MSIMPPMLTRARMRDPVLDCFTAGERADHTGRRRRAAGAVERGNHLDVGYMSTAT